MRSSHPGSRRYQCPAREKRCARGATDRKNDDDHPCECSRGGIRPGWRGGGCYQRRQAGRGAPLEMPDPSLSIAAKLAVQLDQSYATKTVPIVVHRPINGMPELMALAQPLAEYTLQVYTYNVFPILYLTAVVGPSLSNCSSALFPVLYFKTRSPFPYDCVLAAETHAIY